MIWQLFFTQLREDPRVFKDECLDAAFVGFPLPVEIRQWRHSSIPLPVESALPVELRAAIKERSWSGDCNARGSPGSF
jgi:hypothetical protein